MEVFSSKLSDLSILYSKKLERIALKDENVFISLTMSTFKLLLSLADNLNNDLHIISKQGLSTEIHFKTSTDFSLDVTYKNRYSKCHNHVLSMGNTVLCEINSVKIDIFNAINSPMQDMEFEEKTMKRKASENTQEDGMNVCKYLNL